MRMSDDVSGTAASDSLATARRNIEAMAELESKSSARRSALERISQRISDFASHPSFIVLHCIWFGAWIIANRLTAHALDPYPFTFLTFLVSLEAIFLTSFVLISQSHLEQMARRRAELDLQINLLAEAEMTKLLASINAIAERLGIEAVCDDPEMQSMTAKTDVSAIAEALDAAEVQPQESGK
jgi:uncharacterized membrane protein